MDEKIALIAEKIKAAKKPVVFTGAGISTESGIPDYRSQGGIWDRFRPVYFDEFMSSRESRIILGTADGHGKKSLYGKTQ